MNKDHKETTNFKFVCNRDCEYFPCHGTNNPDEFNCLFCFCPLYALGDQCGGNFTYTEEGIKDCSDCMIPHSKNAYEHVISKTKLLAEMARKK